MFPFEHNACPSVGGCSKREMESPPSNNGAARRSSRFLSEAKPRTTHHGIKAFIFPRARPSSGRGRSYALARDRTTKVYSVSNGEATVSRADVHASLVAIPLCRAAGLQVVKIGTPHYQRGFSCVRDENPSTRVNDMDGERAGGCHGTRSWPSVSPYDSSHFHNGVPESPGATLPQAQRLSS